MTGVLKVITKAKVVKGWRLSIVSFLLGLHDEGFKFKLSWNEAFIYHLVFLFYRSLKLGKLGFMVSELDGQVIDSLVVALKRFLIFISQLLWRLLLWILDLLFDFFKLAGQILLLMLKFLNRFFDLF